MVNRLAYSKWVCKYHIVSVRSIEERSYTTNYERIYSSISGICANGKAWRYWRGIWCPTMYIRCCRSRRNIASPVSRGISKEKQRWWSLRDTGIWSTSSATDTLVTKGFNMLPKTIRPNATIRELRPLCQDGPILTTIRWLKASSAFSNVNIFVLRNRQLFKKLAFSLTNSSIFTILNAFKQRPA